MAAEDPIAAKVLEDLKGTPYACGPLITLSGGSANFTYRGVLSNPLQDGTTSVIIKHAEPYIASSPAWALTVSRSYYEQTMLAALASRSTETSNIHVMTPRLYQYSSVTDTQIMEDYPSSLELKKYITTHPVSLAEVERLGVALGNWLKEFHAWGSAPEQIQLREKMKGNHALAQVKFAVNYGRTLATIDMFPNILEEARGLFTAMEEQSKKELQSYEEDLVHGDFWTGNVILQDGPIPPENKPLKLFVVDWEVSHLGSRAHDIGQCFAELYLLTHFRSMKAGIQLISAFMSGYGNADDDMAFQIALHFGVHLIVWPCRVPGWGEGEIMEKCVEIGRDYCKHAWNKDREWFRGGALDKVFFPGAS